MRFRGTLVVALLALGLGVYVYLHEVRGGRERAERRAAAAKLLGIDPAQVTALRITHPSTRLELERRASAWRLVQPLAAPCDPQQVASFLDTLAAARREDEVGRGKLEKYGLDQPAARVEIEVGGRKRTLALGRINPLQTLVYVLVDDSNEVLLTTSTLLTFALNNAFGWRDKRMIDVDPAQVAELRVRTLVAEPLVLQRRGAGGAWVVSGPVPWRADPARTQSLLQGFARLAAVGVAAENRADARRYGVDNRRFGVEVVRGDGSVAGDVVFGFAEGEDRYFGIVPDKPEVFRVDGKLVDLAVEMARDARDRKALPPFLPDKITRIRVRASEDAFELQRRSATDWKVVSSSKFDSTFALATGAVDQLLTELVALDLTDFPAAQPPAGHFDAPEITVQLFEGDRQVSGLEIGHKDPRSIHIFARGPGEPAAFLLAPTALLHVPFDLERLKAEEAPAPEGAERG
jgi:hypothetical protein